MTHAQLPVSPPPARISSSGITVGQDGAAAAGAGVRAGSFMTALATALGTVGGVGAMPVSGDPQSPLMAAPAADPSLTKLPDAAQDFFPGLPPVPGAPVGKIAGTLQSAADVAAGKPHGNGPSRTGRATPGGATGDTMETTGAQIAGFLLHGLPYSGEAAAPSVRQNFPGLLANEPPAIGFGNPAGDGGAGKPRLAGPRVGTQEPSRSAASAVAVPPAIPGREETVLPGLVLPASKSMSMSISAADPLGGLAIVPAGHPLPEGLAALFGASAGAAPSMGPVRGPAADAGFTALPATASDSVYPQIAPALVSLTGGPAGMQRLSLRLDPTELGLVHIRIDRSPDLPPEIRITADRPETLLLLQRDQLELHRALDHAGVPAEGRQVIFQAGTLLPDAPGPNSAGASSSDSSFSAGFSAGSYSDGSGQGQAGQHGTRSRPGGDGLDTEDFMPGGSGPATSGRRWLRAGVDIVA